MTTRFVAWVSGNFIIPFVDLEKTGRGAGLGVKRFKSRLALGPIKCELPIRYWMGMPSRVWSSRKKLGGQ